MTEFGKLLRNFRKKSDDPNDSTRRLSQERLGQLIGVELGDQGFSGAAISDWERGQSKIHADNRLILISIVKVLNNQGGINTLGEANQLLEAGNYRILNEAERRKVFPEDSDSLPEKTQSILLDGFLIGSNDSLRASINEAREGPLPTWPRILIALWRNTSEPWSASFPVQAVIWIWLWIFTWILIAPSLRLPFSDPAQVSFAMRLYVTATLIFPLLIGLLTKTNEDKFWRKHNLANHPMTRLYGYQGAGIGFNLGYFFIFGLFLFGYYMNIRPPIWFEFAVTSLPLALSFMAAHLVPYNLWLAYGRLSLADGWIFFTAALIGSLWGFFFLEFYPTLLVPMLGMSVILIAITLVVIVNAQQSKYK